MEGEKERKWSQKSILNIHEDELSLALVLNEMPLHSPPYYFVFLSCL